MQLNILSSNISLIILFNIAIHTTAQDIVKNKYQKSFEKVYSIFPDIPKGILEAIAYTNTRFHHIVHSSHIENCLEIPYTYGVMGLVLDGKGFFKNNLKFIASLSGYKAEDIINDPTINIFAYATALNQLILENDANRNIEGIIPLLKQLSYIPGGNNGLEFSCSSELFSILTFLNTPAFQSAYGFPEYNIDFEKFFGTKKYHVLASKKVIINGQSIRSDDGTEFASSSACNDYTNCLWVPADASNYSSRNGTQITAITIHDVEGTYSGCIAWFQNPSANVSAHYVLRSSDGQITQMVCEADKAWHVGSENPYTIGFEHEGYASQQGWYTTAMYAASADLARDICNSGYGINPLRTAYFPWASTTYYNQSNIPGACIRIKGHQHYPNQTHTDPGPNWDWDYYYKLININPSITTLTTYTGQLYDSGGPNGDYSNDERLLWLIQPPNADTITLQIDSFSVEQDWDYLYVYNGATEFDSLIAYYTGTSIPSTITAIGGSMLIEFRSDCATTSSGWEFHWTASTITSGNYFSSELPISFYPTPFNDHLTFSTQLPSDMPIEIELFDITGKQLFSIKRSLLKGKGCIQLDKYITPLSIGFYCATVSTPQNKYLFKLIKE